MAFYNGNRVLDLFTPLIPSHCQIHSGFAFIFTFMVTRELLWHGGHLTWWLTIVWYHSRARAAIVRIWAIIGHLFQKWQYNFRISGSIALQMVFGTIWCLNDLLYFLLFIYLWHASILTAERIEYMLYMDTVYWFLLLQ